ncbi:zinc-dependent alcohol dehydrogenase [Psychrobacillus soli]|uniref:Zinc-binding dehydrogenase n=1 Tax=Psychrobacillus soli TaxID=1543965 RepID=A0A544TDK2_9BACI|nr:alcohol dehydrogenase catalytic domain-containing protein [Psychrobacillus soli]TQR15538.1 zinc-binding dehydrogenase [Psychrobacillus soli]
MTKSKKMKIVSPLEIKITDQKIPKLQNGEVLIRITHTGICGTDLKIFDGTIPYVKEGTLKYPHTPGHEWVGIIENVGPEVDPTIQIGDRVTGECHIGCGHCEDCANGRSNVCQKRARIGILGVDGSFGNFMVFPNKAVHKIPDTISDKQAVLIEPLTVATFALDKLEKVPGSTLVIFGLGPIGLLVSEVARVMGAAKVIGIDMNSQRMETALRMGCDIVLNAGDPDLSVKVKEATYQKGPDIIVEASGVGSVLSLSLNLIRAGGQLSLIGLYRDDVTLDANLILTKDLKIHGNMASARVWERAIRLLESGKLNIDSLITHRFPFENSDEAFATAYYKKEESIKVIVEM